MIVDCGDCKVRDIACADCVVTVLLGAPGWGSERSDERRVAPAKIALDQEELGAIDVLAEGGLVPHLQLVVDGPRPDVVESLSSRDSGADRFAV